MKTPFVSIALALLGAMAQAQDVPSLLKTADRFRSGGDNMQVDSLVTLHAADGTPEKERRYTVFSQLKHQSLVLMQSPAEKGQKVLMLGDDFWLLMPGSQRPMRITPMQKLLGDASTGDIATLSWSEDYTGTLVGEEKCGDIACLHLSLQASRKSVSYQHIELWLGKARHEPIKADLFVQSDKLAKQARFVMDKGQTLVTEMVLQDQISNKKETRIRYVSRTPRTVPENWLNPMFLARNPSLD
nr:outer membrane lipoprotein-sorting protein [uncultured Roseateles sp.]